MKDLHSILIPAASIDLGGARSRVRFTVGSVAHGGSFAGRVA